MLKLRYGLSSITQTYIKPPSRRGLFSEFTYERLESLYTTPIYTIFVFDVVD